MRISRKMPLKRAIAVVAIPAMLVGVEAQADGVISGGLLGVETEYHAFAYSSTPFAQTSGFSNSTSIAGPDGTIAAGLGGYYGGALGANQTSYWGSSSVAAAETGGFAGSFAASGGEYPATSTTTTQSSALGSGGGFLKLFTETESEYGHIEGAAVWSSLF